MDAIKEFLESIWSSIQAIWEFLSDIVHGIIDAIRYMYLSMQQLSRAVDSLPVILKVYASITITIMIILFISNRSGGKSDA